LLFDLLAGILDGVTHVFGTFLGGFGGLIRRSVFDLLGNVVNL
jgi:hypothetical protein